MSGDVLAFGLRPKGEQEAITKEAERLSRVTDANAKLADDLRMRWDAIKLTVEGLGQVLLEKVTPFVERLLPIIERLGNRFADWLSTLKTGDVAGFFDRVDNRIDSTVGKLEGLLTVINGVLNLFKTANEAGESIGQRLYEATHLEAAQAGGGFHPKPGQYVDHGIGAWVKRWFTKASLFSDEFAAAEMASGLPPGTMTALMKQESGGDPTAFNTQSGARGLFQLNPKYFKGAGVDPHADLAMASVYLGSLVKQFGSLDKELAAYDSGP